MRIRKITTSRFTTRPLAPGTSWAIAMAEANEYAMRLYARTHLHF